MKIIYNYQSDRFLKLFMTTTVEVHNWVGVCHHVFVQISYFFQVWRTTFCSTKSGNPWEFPSDSNHAEYQMKYTRNLHTFSIIWEITFIASIFLSHLFMVLRFLRLPSLIRHLKTIKIDNSKNTYLLTFGIMGVIIISMHLVRGNDIEGQEVIITSMHIVGLILLIRD